MLKRHLAHTIYNIAQQTCILQIGLAPASIVGRYSCPYNNIAKPQWWDTQKSGGCIVEQATHFVDLMRYLSGGDIIQESIQAVAVGPDMPLKEMPTHPQAEHLVSHSSPNAAQCLQCSEQGSTGHCALSCHIASHCELVSNESLLTMMCLRACCSVG